MAKAAIIFISDENDEGRSEDVLEDSGARREHFLFSVDVGGNARTRRPTGCGSKNDARLDVAEDLAAGS